MDSFQAAVLNLKLPRLDAWNESRRRVAASYSRLLRDLPYRLPAVLADSESVWHCYVIESERRDALRAYLLAAGIETAIHYPVPLHLQPAYAFLKHGRGDFPVSETISDRCLSLPIYPELGDEAIAHVAACLREFAKKS
jgi:dTDP-4-amino-4,6-dideoxygalactose transaminase